MISCYHGLIGNSRNWAPLSQILSKADKILSNDIDYIRKSFSDIIEEEHAQIQNSFGDTKIAVGNSLGCLIALGVGKSVNHIILTAPPYMGKASFIPRSREGLENYIRGLYCDRPLTQDEKTELSTVGRRFSLILSDKKNIPKLKILRRSLREFAYWDLVMQHKEKVHIVLGDEDHLSPKEEILSYLNEYIPEVKVDILQGCGHAVPLEQPEKLAEIVESYK